MPMKIRQLHIFFLLLLFHVQFAIGNSHLKSALSPPTTQIGSSYCGGLLPTINTPISANVIAGTTAYRFKVVTENTNPIVEQVYTSAIRTFNLTQLPNYAYATTYRIQVAMLYQGVWQPYGSECILTTPTPTTMVESNQCGQLLSHIDDYIYVNAVPFATGYKYRLTNIANPNDVYITTSVLKKFKINTLPVQHGASYMVEVAVRNCDGNYLPYGQTCQITLPVVFSRILATHCGSTLTSLSDIIYATIVPGATGYRFKVSNLYIPADVQVLDRNLRQFSMSLLSNIHHDTPYKIEVAVKDVYGNYGGYGPFCTLSTPVLRDTRIQESQCEMGVANSNTMMFAEPVAGAITYRFKLINTNIGYSHYIDRTQNCYNLSMFPGLLPGTTYTIKVAVKIGAYFGNFGKGCDVTTVNSGQNRDVSETKALENAVFEIAAAPNPFSNYINLRVNSASTGTVSIKTYDLTGRLLEAEQVEIAEVATLEIGQDYPSGVYLIVVKQGDSEKILRVIKR